MMEGKELPTTIDTVADLIAWLQMYPSDATLDVRYDSGYGDGSFVASSFLYNKEKHQLRIDVS